MSISASDVKSLREKTGAGMMDCKKALTETSGDVEAAVDFLRKKGLAAAQKKQSRVAAEGAVVTQIKGNTAVAVEVNCETDFVAKGDDFQSFAKKAAETVLAKDIDNIDGLKEATNETATELTLKCGEKIDVRRLSRLDLQGTGLIGNYNHGGKIGVLVEISTDTDVAATPAAQDLAKDVAMHIAAADPKFVGADEIDEDFKKREAEIYSAQLKEQGKPEAMIPKIVEGKLKKLATEVCLLEQKFVKNPDLSISKHIDAVAKELGTKITVKRFSKIGLGEGIEKREDNLADEVAKMTGKQ